MKKIKVLRSIARLNIGGPTRHVVFLTEGLEKGSFDSVLVYGSVEKGEGDMSYLVEERGLKAVFIPDLERKIHPVKDLKAFIKIFSTIRREKPDIVHTHTAKAGMLGRLAAILAGVPIKIHTYHGHVFYGYFNKPSTWLFLTIERTLARFTDRIIAISEKQRQELLNVYKIGNAKQYKVINLGFEIEKFADPVDKGGKFRQRYNFGKDDILVGIVGRLVPVKNHRFFINVINRIKELVPQEVFLKVKFIIIGDGPEKESLINFSRSKGVSNNVFFIGWIKDVEEAYADIDIVALTSKNEGTPLSLIEALASSKPVISTDVGGVRDAIGENGILVDESDEEAFAEGLKELILSRDSRIKVGSKGRDYVMKRFSKGNLIKEMEKLYSELMTEKGITV